MICKQILASQGPVLFGVDPSGPKAVLSIGFFVVIRALYDFNVTDL